MRSLEWALILYDWCPYKKRDVETQIHTHTHWEAEIAVLWLSDKEH